MINMSFTGLEWESYPNQPLNFLVIMKSGYKKSMGKSNNNELFALLGARLDEISKRIDRVEQDVNSMKQPKPPWYKPKTAQEVITLIGIPAAFVVAIFAFYDGVWLKLQRLDAATVTTAQNRLEELQDLRKEVFIMQTRGEDAEIAALVEAKQSRRDRLVQDSFRYWQKQPSYFTKKETILLAEELQLQNRQNDALVVLENVKAEGSIEKSDLARFRASLYGAVGPSQSLEKARKLFKAALKHANTLESEAGKQQLWAKISFHWLFIEMSNNTACTVAKLPAETLIELLANDPDQYNLGVLDANARKLIVTYEDRCVSD